MGQHHSGATFLQRAWWGEGPAAMIRHVGMATDRGGGRRTKVVSPQDIADEFEGKLRKLMLDVIRRLERTGGATWFAEPVDAKEVPDYYTLIEVPMDLATLRKVRRFRVAVCTFPLLLCVRALPSHLLAVVSVCFFAVCEWMVFDPRARTHRH